MAGFLSKETIALEADRLGVSLEGLSWPEQQEAIAEARRAEKEKMAAEVKPEPEPKPERESTVVDDAREKEIAELKRELAEAKEQAKAVPQVPVVCELGLNVVEPTIEDYDRVVLIASPEQKPTPQQPGKYYEEVGTQKITTERSLDVGKLSPFGPNESGTKVVDYDIKDTGRPVNAESTMPKYSCLLTYRPTKDLCAVAEFQGHRGYLWTHQRLPNVKSLLQQMGVYEEFHELWDKRHGAKFYLGGLICVDISFTDETMQRIVKELRRRAKAGEDEVL